MKIFDIFIQRNLSNIEYKRLIQLGWVRLKQKKSPNVSIGA